MTCKESAGITDDSLTALKTGVHDMMLRLGFEETQIRHQPVYRIRDKYVKISYAAGYAAVEIADSLTDAENNMYEDLDLYDFDYMKGMDISAEIEKDIVNYVLGQHER